MPQTTPCPRCQSPLPGDAPEGLCPKCLLLHNLSTFGSAEPPSPARPGSFAAPTPAELAPLFPQLQILELLGQGGMGAVYKARQPALDRQVALKILPPESQADPAFAERFTREAVALGKLNHPNVVMVYDFGQVHGLYYFVMEYVDGMNLRQLLRSGLIQPAEALKIVPQICDALQYAHDEGIVHRDIKPENILLDKKGRVKIADFGIAKILGAKASSYTLTGPWQVMGTAHYMAPEQMEKPLSVDHRADIYSLGVVFYELLTGQLPVGRFAPPSKKVQIDVRLDEVVLRALENEPEKRYQHASDVKTDLQACASPAADGVAAERTWWLGQPPHVREAIRFGLALVAIVGAVAFLGYSGNSTLGEGPHGPERYFTVAVGLVQPWATFVKDADGFRYEIHWFAWSFFGGVALLLAVWSLVRIGRAERQRRPSKPLQPAAAAPAVPALPAAVVRALGFEYRSQRTLFGLPLVHIAKGIDPLTGRKRIAKGIVAIGDIAIGVLAFGGVAMGGICFGGCSVGVLALGGATVGLAAIGGLAIGLLVALGGLAVGALAVGGGAVGLIAYGGGAVGYYAMGGGAWGVHPWGGNARDPIAHAFFEPSLVARFNSVLDFLSKGPMLGLWMGAIAVMCAILAYFQRRTPQSYSSAGSANGG